MAAVGWRQLKGLAQQIDGAEIREGERKASFPGGGWFQVRSADDPDSLRGEGLDRVILDECAFIAEAAWTEALRPALSDRKGDALFISTPKGQNWFWRHWIKGQEDDAGEWMSWRFPSVSNPFLDPVEVESAAHDLPERTYQQEYCAIFLEDGGGVFRGVTAAVDRGRTRPEPHDAGRNYTLGVDVAKVEDFTVLSVVDDRKRQVYFERFNQVSHPRLQSRVIDVAKKYNARVYLDSTGVGDPTFDVIRQAGIACHGYVFTNASKEAAIENLAIGIENGTARLMDIPTQTNELLAYQYELTPSRNVRMNAPEGMHDDCVIGLALAYWGQSSRRVLTLTG